MSDEPSHRHYEAFKVKDDPDGGTRMMFHAVSVKEPETLPITALCGEKGVRFTVANGLRCRWNPRIHPASRVCYACRSGVWMSTQVGKDL